MPSNITAREDSTVTVAKCTCPRVVKISIAFIIIATIVECITVNVFFCFVVTVVEVCCLLYWDFLGVLNFFSLKITIKRHRFLAFLSNPLNYYHKLYSHCNEYSMNFRGTLMFVRFGDEYDDRKDLLSVRAKACTKRNFILLHFPTALAWTLNVSMSLYILLNSTTVFESSHLPILGFASLGIMLVPRLFAIIIEFNLFMKLDKLLIKKYWEVSCGYKSTEKLKEHLPSSATPKSESHKNK